jgi:hypothetical protein
MRAISQDNSRPLQDQTSNVARNTCTESKDGIIVYSPVDLGTSTDCQVYVRFKELQRRCCWPSQPWFTFHDMSRCTVCTLNNTHVAFLTSRKGRDACKSRFKMCTTWLDQMCFNPNLGLQAPGYCIRTRIPNELAPRTTERRG